MKKLLSSKKLMLILTFAGLYLLSAGASLAVFTFLNDEPVVNVGDNVGSTRTKVGANQPKTETCPINGAKFTKAERDIWQTRRPITAMIENHADSRPQSGVSRADVVYEAVAEGGITRFMGVFYCGAAAEDVKIAPVRSARIYFIDWAAGFADYPIFMHVGGANNFSGSGDTAKEVRALEALETIGWRVPKGNDFDTTYDSGFPVFWRNYERLDHEVATEHTMMASLDEAYTVAEKRGFGAKNKKGIAWDENFTGWKFGEDKAASTVSASEISFSFWNNKPEYDVIWKYDQATNRYLRVNGGASHIDLENKEQLSAKNVIVIFTQEKGPVDRNMHMYYKSIGSGEALIFHNGEVIEGTWTKLSREDLMLFKDSRGKEINLTPGTIWVEVLPIGNDVNY